MRISKALAVLTFMTMTFAACDSSQRPSPNSGSPPIPSSTATGRFLSRYVTADGRVIRRDQGGDIVSEGQAYGMLIAEIAADPALVRTIWSWTRAHLMRPDGLFAWHATSSGKIEDPESATDADILIAYALLRYRGANEAALHSAGRRTALAILANESVKLPDGTLLPVAGPWAVTTVPPTVNPSYLMPGIFDAIAEMTADPRWRAAADASSALVAQLTDNGTKLPPDWAQLQGSSLVPSSQPSGGAPVQYGLDAARLPLWFATGCSAAQRQIAAGWWRNVLSTGARPTRLALSLSGEALDTARSPLTYMAGAAAATAAGDTSRAQSLVAAAQDLASSTPTYYGDAWVALGNALLGHELDPCKEATDG